MTLHISVFYLEKAFDFVEYSILLYHTYKLGVNGKCWHLIKEWYSNTSSVVRVNDRRSESFTVKRGVKQGSVLSPTLFIAVTDSLLSFLESSGQGLAISGLNMGNSAHADDIRAASISIDAAQIQGELSDSFSTANSLKLKANNTELIQFTSGKHTSHTHEIAGQNIQTQVEFLGVWWRYDYPLSSLWRSVFTKQDVLFCTGLHWSISWKIEPTHWT